MKKGQKNTKGITLIALVVTIIILIVIAGVSIVALKSDNSIIKNTNKSSILANLKSEEESIVLKISTAKTDVISEGIKIDIITDIFKLLSGDDEIVIKALKGDLIYANIDNSDGVTGFKINLKETKGFIFTLDTDYNIIGVNDRAIADWENESSNVHAHVFNAAETIEPTCTESGKTRYKCEKCGYEYIEITEEPVGHNFEEKENILEATCENVGINRAVCSVCGEVEEEQIPILGHLKSTIYSYTSEGHYISCSRCGLRLTDIESHNSNSCTVCGYTGIFNVTYELGKMTSSNTSTTVSAGSTYTTTITPINSLAYQRPDSVSVRMGGELLTSGYTYNSVNGTITINNINGDIVISASADRYYGDNTSFTNAKEIELNTSNSANIDQSYRIRVFKFVPTETGTYKFYSNDSSASSNSTDPYAYLFDNSKYDEDELDDLALQYSQNGKATILQNNCLIYNDDGGTGYNFSMTYSCTAGKTYYLVIRTYNTSKVQSFSNI